MAEGTQYSERDRRYHTAKLKQMPWAQALFETTAEVMIGLQKADQDFEDRSEQAWKGAAG